MRTVTQRNQEIVEVNPCASNMCAANDASHKIRMGTGETHPTNRHILIIKWDNTNVGRITDLFKGKGYTVSVCCGNQPLDQSRYAAVIHTARVSETLASVVGTTYSTCVDDWALIATDEVDDIHCVVQLTERANKELQAYVRYLWALCSLS